MLPTATLAALIDRKRDVLAQLHELASRQMKLVAESDGSPELMPLLAVKQTLLDQLQQVERELAPYRDEDPDARPWPTPAARQQCAQVAAQCERLLAEAMDLEQRCLSEMQSRRDSTAAAIGLSGEAAQARAAYGTTAMPSSSQIDLASES